MKLQDLLCTLQHGAQIKLRLNNTETYDFTLNFKNQTRLFNGFTERGLETVYVYSVRILWKTKIIYIEAMTW